MSTNQDQMSQVFNFAQEQLHATFPKLHKKEIKLLASVCLVTVAITSEATRAALILTLVAYMLEMGETMEDLSERLINTLTLIDHALGKQTPNQTSH